MDTIKELSSSSCEALLLENILPFWINRMVDKEQGGFYGRIDGENRLHAHAPKGIILNARILWTFAAVARKYPDSIYKETARRAYEYIITHFLDSKSRGVFWMLDADGAVLEGKKQVYAQAFTIYALSEYYAAVHDEAALGLAKELYSITEKHSFDSIRNGYLEAFDQEWDVLEDLRLSDKDANEAKTMNTHLHVLEAYTNLYRVWKDDGLKQKLENLIRLFLDKFIDDQGHFHLFFDENWKLKSAIYSYGHDIEGGWLLHEAAEVLGDTSLIQETKLAAIKLTEAALEGLDTDGALMNEGDLHGVEDTDKHWWPQAEALVGLVNAWKISGDKKYLDLARKNWRFTVENLIDPGGEWYWMVNKERIVNTIEDKAGPWKCPYHNGRAMLELIHRLEKLT